MMRSSKVKRWEKGRRWLASSILLAALSIVAARSNAAILVTGTIETTNGSNSNASGASWNSWGALTYWASTEDTFLFVTHYGWEDAKHFFYGLSGYVDADVYHRRFIYYNPGSPSLIWESCSLNNMDVTTIPTNGSWTALADDGCDYVVR